MLLSAPAASERARAAGASSLRFLRAAAAILTIYFTVMAKRVTSYNLYTFCIERYGFNGFRGTYTSREALADLTTGGNISRCPVRGHM